jgi:uncharacterized membrane protein
MMGDRAEMIFAEPEEISKMIEATCKVFEDERSFLLNREADAFGHSRDYDGNVARRPALPSPRKSVLAPNEETPMKKTVRVLGATISAFVLAYSAVGAMAQPQPDQQAHSHSMDQEGAGTVGQGGMMCGGMMGRGMMGRGMMGSGMMGGGMMGGQMGSPMMFRMMFALMDDGDGEISLQEFQAAHARIFKAMDKNKDGQVTQEEMQAFMHGRSSSSASPQ